MAWTHVPGLAGRVYVPDDGDRAQKKHACKTCFACQWCDENRCQVCRADHASADPPESSPCCNRQPHRRAKADRPTSGKTGHQKRQAPNLK